MEVSYSTMIAAGNLVKRLAQNARRLEKALAETMNTSAEWKRIADELKAERNALRSTTIDTAAGRLLDAFGSLTNEPRNRAPDDEYRDRIVNKIHSIKMERDALRADVNDLRTLCDQWKQRETELLAEIERLKKPSRQHPVAVGEWVERTESPYTGTPIGYKARVVEVGSANYRLSCGRVWEFSRCSPCDPPEATHDTPAGKDVAGSVIRNDRKTDLLSWHCPRCKRTVSSRESMTFCPSCAGHLEGAPCVPATAVKTEPKPGDVVRLVRVPTNDEYPHDSGRWEPNWGGIGDYMRVHYVGSNINGTRVVRAVFGLEWPLSCVEVVKGGDK